MPCLLLLHDLSRLILFLMCQTILELVHHPSVIASRKSLVGLRVHQRLKLLGTFLVNLNLGDPASANAIILGDLVDGRGLLLEGVVDVGDAKADRSVDVGGGLDRLDGTDSVTLLDPVVDLRELNVDDVTELFGGVGRETNDTGLLVCREINPLVVF